MTCSERTRDREKKSEWLKEMDFWPCQYYTTSKVTGGLGVFPLLFPLPPSQAAAAATD